MRYRPGNQRIAVRLPRACAPVSAAPPIATGRRTHRRGPASASSAGARSGSHGRNGTTQRPRSASGDTDVAKVSSLPRRSAMNAPAATTTPTPASDHQRRASGGSSAIRAGPRDDHATISIDAGLR